MNYHSAPMGAFADVSRGLLAALVVLASLLAVPAAARAQDPPPAGAKILLVFDASGSMRSDSGNGTPKLQAAKDAALALLGDLPDSTHVGLRLFGGTLPSRPIARACRDSSLVLPIGPATRGEAKERIQSFKARGRTPIAYALQQAARDLGTEGSRTIILVSDGKDTCPPPRPCDVAAEIAKGGVELRIQAIGFNVDPSSRRQLECIAEAGGGVYRDAGDAASLREELRILSTRALRRYVVRGKPIKGGPSARAATAVAPGRYVDRTITPDSVHWYAVDLRRGETLKASASVIPPNREVADDTEATELKLDIATPSFQIPDRQNSSASGEPFELRGHVGGIGVVSRPIGVGAQAAADEPFSQPGRYYLRLELDDTDDKALYNATGGQPYEVEMAVEVLGRRGGSVPPPSGKPGKPDTEGPKPAPGPAEPPAPALLTLVGGGVAALGFGGGLAAVRRRRGGA